MSTMEAPVATMTSTMLCFTMSTYTCMQPPAEVEPARVSHRDAFLSARFMLNMSAALAVSLEEKDMPRYASMICLPSIFLISMCLIDSLSSSFFVVFVLAIYDFSSTVPNRDGYPSIYSSIRDYQAARDGKYIFSALINFIVPILMTREYFIAPYILVKIHTESKLIPAAASSCSAERRPRKLYRCSRYPRPRVPGNSFSGFRGPLRRSRR